MAARGERSENGTLIVVSMVGRPASAHAVAAVNNLLRPPHLGSSSDASARLVTSPMVSTFLSEVAKADAHSDVDQPVLISELGLLDHGSDALGHSGNANDCHLRQHDEKSLAVNTAQHVTFAQSRLERGGQTLQYLVVSRLAGGVMSILSMISVQ